MIDDTRTILQKKADAYYLLKEKVHVTLKTGHWLNGLIIEISADFFIVDETLQGKTPVFFQEIKSIEKYTRKEWDNGK